MSDNLMLSAGLSMVIGLFFLPYLIYRAYLHRHPWFHHTRESGWDEDYHSLPWAFAQYTVIILLLSCDYWSVNGFRKLAYDMEPNEAMKMATNEAVKETITTALTLVGICLAMIDLMPGYLLLPGELTP